MVDLSVPIIGIAAFVVIAVVDWLRDPGRRGLSVLARAGSALRLSVLAGNEGEYARLSGEREGFLVGVEVVALDRDEGSPPSQGIAVLVRSSGRWPSELHQPGRWRFAAAKATSFTALPPPAQESEAALESRQAARLAVFDADTARAFGAWRDKLRAQRRPRAEGSVHAGTLVVLLDELVGEPKVLGAHLDAAVELAHALDRQGRPLATCIAEGLPGLDAADRRARLRLLVERYPRHESALAAFPGYLDDPDASVRYEAARGVGAEGRETLEAIARDTTLSPALRGDAIAAWAAGMVRRPREHALAAPVVVALAGDESRRVRMEALRAADRLGIPCELASLLKRIAAATDEECVELARALARHAMPDAEAALLVLLRKELLPIRVEALRALRSAGSAACVADVLPLSKALLAPAELKAEARETLRFVRARLGPAEAGQLSWAEHGADGSLSLPSSEGGALSRSGQDGELSPRSADDAPT